MKSLIHFFVEHTLFAVLFIALFFATAISKLFFWGYQHSKQIVTGKKYHAQYHPI